MITSLPRQKAEAHERLYPALARLTAQVEAIAARRPAAAVPAATRAVAADLLYEAQAFGWDGPNRTRRRLLEPATDMAGLATQLGQALALLDAFEAAHSHWNPDLKCFVWQGRGGPHPVKRLRAEPQRPPETAKDKRLREQRQVEVRRLILAKADDAYDRGYADASSGHEHRGASS